MIASGQLGAPVDCYMTLHQILFYPALGFTSSVASLSLHFFPPNPLCSSTSAWADKEVACWKDL